MPYSVNCSYLLLFRGLKRSNKYLFSNTNTKLFLEASYQIYFLSQHVLKDFDMRRNEEKYLRKY